MQELEKILEEIESKKFTNMTIKHSMVVKMEDVKDIIRKHMNDNNSCGECSRRKWYQIGYKDGKDDGWISVEERLPTKEECKKDNNEFLVQTDAGERFSCEYDPLANGFDNPLWCCNVPVVAWQPLPEPYKPERMSND